MPEGLSAAAFAVAFAAVLLMGYAIQRGATCTVAAMDEIVHRRRGHRLAAIAEAAMWVAGGLALLQALHGLPAMPATHAASGWTVAGGLLLGLGAYVNRACVFGAIARLGSGEWAYLATPVGFYLGCLGDPMRFGRPPSVPLATPSPLLAAADGAALLFVLYAAWRLGRPAVAAWRNGSLAALPARARTPHAATVVIGITFLVTLLAAGAWAYTDVLAELARGMAAGIAPRAALLGALLAGAWWGGYRAGRLRATAPTPARIARCLAGGMLMGCGSLCIPGGNDGLILVGLPLLRPYAWLAFATMCLAIGAALVAERRFVATRTETRHA